MKWVMVAIIVGSTVLADLLQSFEMKRNVVAVEDLRPGQAGRLARADWPNAVRWCWRSSSWRSPSSPS